MPSSELSRLLRHGAFVRFWLARCLGLTANQMLMLAVSWYVYDLTGSAMDLGWVGLIQFVPALLMTLPAGHVVDRCHRARVFALCLLAQAIVAAVLWFSVGHQGVTRELIFVLAGVLGVVRAFQMPAQQAITPALVPSDLLQRAIALSSSGVQTSVIGGPALGGLIYAVSPAGVYATCTVLLLMGLVLTLQVHYRHVVSAQTATWASVFAGLRFVMQRKELLGAISLDLFAVLLGGATALLPVYARDILHTGPEGLGLLRAAPAVGALLMSLAIARWPLRRRVGRKMLGAIAVFGLATLVFGLSTHFWLSLLALAVTGAADNISVVVRLTLLQLETPDEMRGRVSAVNGIFIGASNQLGEFESGATAAWLGPVGSVVLGGIGTVLVAWAWWHWFPTLARRDTLDQPTT
jgi:MFS family permease